MSRVGPGAWLPPPVVQTTYRRSMGWTEVLSGAAGGAVSSLLVASAIAERAERGRRRAEARAAVRRVASSFAQQVTLSDLRRGAGPAEELKAVESGRQQRLASEILQAADGLGWVRSRRVRRALTALVGPLRVGLAEDLPYRPADFAGDAVRASLWFQANGGVVEQHARRPGLLDQAAQDQTSGAAWKAAGNGVRKLIDAC